MPRSDFLDFRDFVSVENELNKRERERQSRRGK